MHRKKRMLLFAGFIILMIIRSGANASQKTVIAKRKGQIKKLERTLASEDNQDIPVIGDKYDLSDYIRLGLERNPELKAAFFGWKASFRKIAQEFSLPDPQFSYTNYLEPVETRVGPQKNAYSIMQKIPLPDKLWIRKSRQFRSSEAAFYRFVQQKQNLIYRITDVYYEYAYLAKAIELTEENMHLLQQFEAVAQRKYAAGIAKSQDVLKVQTELEKLDNEYRSLLDMRLPVQARLNALLNLPASTEIPWPEETFDNIGTGAFTDEIQNFNKRMKQQNPELLSLRETFMKNKDDVKLAKREYFPDLAIKLTAIDTGEALNPDTIDNGKNAVMLMFTVNVPLWFWKNNARIDAAKSMTRSSENLLQNKENELMAELQFVYYKLKDSLRQVRLYRESLLPRAIQTLNATKSAYEAGTVDFLSLIDSQRMLLRFQLAFCRFATSYHQYLAKLKKLLGEEENVNSREFKEPVTANNENSEN